MEKSYVDEHELGQVMRELSVLRRDVDGVRSSLDTVRQSVAHLDEDHQRVSRQTEELSTIKRLGAALLSAVLALGSYLVYTTIRSEERLETLSRAMESHLVSGGHQHTITQLTEIGGDVKEIRSSLSTWRASQGARIDRLDTRVDALTSESRRRHR